MRAFCTLVSSVALLNIAKKLNNKGNFKAFTIVEVEYNPDKETIVDTLQKRVKDLGADLFETIPYSSGLTANLFNFADSGPAPVINGTKPGLVNIINVVGESPVVVHYLSGKSLCTGNIKRRNT